MLPQPAFQQHNFIPAAVGQDMDVTDRFTNRVEDYISYRPNYPESVVELLKTEYGLSASHEIADIGAGVGHSTRLFAPHVAYIYAIEPNEAMHTALVRQLAELSNCSARLQAAENTDLEARSVDFIICGQAYHWFEPRMTKTEFERIINDEGYVVLMWNQRRKDSEFGTAYEQFIQDYSVDYNEVKHTRLEDKDFDFLLHTWKRYELDNAQKLDLQGLIGRYSSSSYAPAPGTDQHKQAAEALKTLFDHYAVDGTISIDYRCEVIVGKI